MVAAEFDSSIFFIIRVFFAEFFVNLIEEFFYRDVFVGVMIYKNSYVTYNISITVIKNLWCYQSDKYKTLNLQELQFFLLKISNTFYKFYPDLKRVTNKMNIFLFKELFFIF